MQNTILKNLNEQPILLPLLFWDGIKMTEPNLKVPQRIEEEEDGYFKALFLLFINKLQSVTLDQPVSADDIVDLYKQCIDGVNIPNKGDNFGDKIANSFDGIFYLEDLDSHLKYATKFNNLAPYIGLRNPNPNPMFNFKLDPANNEKVEDVVSITGFYEKLKKIDPEAKIIFCYSNNLTQAENKELVEGILAQYHEELYLAQTDLAKIAAIVNVVQQLERLHPFRDANCRTFCMALLNLELIKSGLHPTIQDDPNAFDFLPVNKLVEQVMVGQEKFKKLAEKKSKPEDLNFVAAHSAVELPISHLWLEQAQELITEEIKILLQQVSLNVVARDSAILNPAVVGTSHLAMQQIEEDEEQKIGHNAQNISFSQPEEQQTINFFSMGGTQSLQLSNNVNNQCGYLVSGEEIIDDVKLNMQSFSSEDLRGLSQNLILPPILPTRTMGFFQSSLMSMKPTPLNIEAKQNTDSLPEESLQESLQESRQEEDVITENFQSARSK